MICAREGAKARRKEEIRSRGDAETRSARGHRFRVSGPNISWRPQRTNVSLTRDGGHGQGISASPRLRVNHLFLRAFAPSRESKKPQPNESGFTLIEVMISLGLFGLIAIAGLALVSGIINVQGRTDTRLERLAELQRTMFVITSDLDQIARGPIAGGAGEVSFTRAAPGSGGAPVPIRYGLAGNAFLRFLGPRPQLLLPGVNEARWRFWDGQWVDKWPRDEKQAGRWPRAIEVRMQIASPGGPAGTLRRVVVLPVQAEPPAAEPSPSPSPSRSILQ